MERLGMDNAEFSFGAPENGESAISVKSVNPMGFAL
jgi:hypothetical protein